MSTTAPTTMPTPALSSSAMGRGVDPWLSAAVVTLLGLGALMVYSASAVRAAAAGADAHAYLFKHVVSVAIGLVVMALTVRVPVDRWSRFAYPLLGLTVVLLAALFVPGLGRRVNGAVRWLSLGPASFQPSEFAKLSVVLYLAHSLAKKRDQVSSFSMGFLPHIIVTSLIAGLILIQPDLGTAVVIMTTMGGLLFVAGTRLGYLAGAFVLTLPVMLHYVTTRPHALKRLVAFLDPEAHRSDVGYQAWESLVAFGSGRAWGVGLGNGSQKLFFLPEGHTDFLFAVLGQELGFAGVLATLIAFGVLLARTFRTAHRLPCRFPMFLVFGIGLWFAVQIVVHIGVVMALLPTKGLTLPLMSFGRTSMIMSLAAMGIVCRASAEVDALSERR